MLASEPPNVEQPRFDLFEPCRVEGPGVSGPCDLFLGLAPLDHRAVERRERFAEKGMLGRTALDPPRRLPQQRERAFRTAKQLIDTRKRFAGLESRLH